MRRGPNRILIHPVFMGPGLASQTGMTLIEAPPEGEASGQLRYVGRSVRAGRRVAAQGGDNLLDRFD